MNDLIKQLDTLLKPVNEAARNIPPAQFIRYTAIYALIAGIARLCISVPAILGGALLGGFAGAASVASTSNSETQQALAEAGRASGLLVVTGIVFLIVAPALIVIGLGLFRRMSWSRMGAVVVFAVSAILSLLDLFAGGGILDILWVLVGLYLAYFFYSDSGIKREFGQV